MTDGLDYINKKVMKVVKTPFLEFFCI